MRGRKMVAAVMLAVLLGIAAFPPSADAGNSITDGLIIGGAVAGAVAAVLIVAILVAGDDEPEFLELVPGPRHTVPASGVRFRCSAIDGTVPLMCW